MKCPSLRGVRGALEALKCVYLAPDRTHRSVPVVYISARSLCVLMYVGTAA